MTRIFVEGFELDLTSDISYQLTFSIDDIRNLDSKTTSFSKTIVIPGTQRNNKIFGNIYELSNANFPIGSQNAFYNFDASKTAQARIEINGLQAMKGTLRLMSITVDKGMIDYEVALFGELGGFIASIGIKKLEELDFSNYNHDWTYGNISSTFVKPNSVSVVSADFAGPYSTDIYPSVYRIRIDSLNVSNLQNGDIITITGSSGNNAPFTVAQVVYNSTLNRTDIYVFEPVQNGTETNFTINIDNQDGYGYVYPLIDYGISNPTGAYAFPLDWDFQTFRPALFVLEYVDKIIKGAGYTWESKFFNTDFFRSLIIPNNDQVLERRGETYFIQGNSSSYLQYPTSGRYIITFTNTTLTDFTFSSGSYTYNGLSSVTVRLKASMLIYVYGLSSAVTSIKMGFFLNGNPVGLFEGPWNENGPLGGDGNTQFSIDQAITVSPNDVIYFGFDYSTTANPTGYIQFAASNTIEVAQDPPGWISYTYGQTININNSLPKNVYQRDFFISIMKLFNLMVVERKDKTKHLVIEPYIDFFNTDRSTYIDWSYKVNREKPIIIKPMSEINSRIYDFKLKDDSDYYNDLYKKRFNQTYGNRIFDNQYEFAKDSQSVEIIFSPSVLVGYDGEDKVFSAIYKVENNVKKTMAHNIRIMQIKRIPGVTEWNITNTDVSGSTALGSQTSYVYAGHFNDPDYPYIDLNWGATKQLFFNITSGSLQYNTFNNFYSPYMAEILDKDSRLVTCEMKLTEKDIFNLDFSRFVMVDGVLFRLMKITDWSEGALAKVDLLRVINTTYIPDTPSTAKVFRMRYDDLSVVDAMLGGSRSSLSDWNAFFGLTAGNNFTSCYVENKDIILLGNLEFEISNSLFKGNTNIIGLWDNIGAIKEIATDAFKDATNMTEVSSISCKAIGDTAFNSAFILHRISFPKAMSCGLDSFAKTDLFEINFASMTSFGANCFNDVTGNVINMTIPFDSQSDAEVTYLTGANTVNLILV